MRRMERAKKQLTVNEPLICETTDCDGRWILVDLLGYRGRGKWDALDEDGQRIVVDWNQLHPLE